MKISSGWKSIRQAKPIARVGEAGYGIAFRREKVMYIPKNVLGICRCCAILVAITVLPACSPAKARRAAEDGVAKFHAQLNAEQYHDIYQNASEEFRSADREEKMTGFFAALHRKLGPIHSCDEQQFFINYSTSGTVITLTYRTQFENGNGVERFVWRVSDQPVLISYQIDSPTLVTN